MKRYLCLTTVSKMIQAEPWKHLPDFDVLMFDVKFASSSHQLIFDALNQFRSQTFARPTVGLLGCLQVDVLLTSSATTLKKGR